MELILVIFIGLILLFIFIYNFLLSKKNHVFNTFSNIDILFKKRYVLAEDLLILVENHMEAHKDLLKKIRNLRIESNKRNLSENKKIDLDEKVTVALSSLIKAIESYQELKSNKNILNLQTLLNKIESQVILARKAYNKAATDYNKTLKMIPTRFVAKLMKYKTKEFFFNEKLLNANF